MVGDKFTRSLLLYRTYYSILQLGNHRLYRYKIYIPSTYMWNAQYLRYKYVVFRANDNQQIEEKLDYNCRIFRKGI